MPHPLFQVKKTVNDPEGNPVLVVEQRPVVIDDVEDTTMGLGFLVGFCEGMLTFMPRDQFPIDVANYDSLDEYQQMRVRELLVILTTRFDGSVVSKVSNQRIKLKHEIQHNPPRVLVYRMEV